MPKCIDILKSIRAEHYGGFHEPPPGAPASTKFPPQRPPYPEGLVIGVCGVGKPRAYLLTQTHLDELPAVTNATFYAAQPLIELLGKERSFLFREEFKNVFVEFRGEFYETAHYGFFERSEGGARLERSPSYCYVLTSMWLTEILNAKIDCNYGYVDEGAKAYETLQEFRAKSLTPLYHWQSRNHIDTGPRLKARDLSDGYLLDNRKKPEQGRNVIRQCVPSLLDVKQDPRWRGNGYAKYIR